jgi:hypothetical protein
MAKSQDGRQTRPPTGKTTNRQDNLPLLSVRRELPERDSVEQSAAKVERPFRVLCNGATGVPEAGQAFSTPMSGLIMKGWRPF